jgi:hypothetical protein
MQLILCKADRLRTVLVIERATNRMIRWNPLPLGAEQMSQATPFSGRDQIAAGWLTVCVALGLDDRVLDRAVRLNAHGERFDVLLAVRYLPNILRRLPEAIEWNENGVGLGLFGSTFHDEVLLGDRADSSPLAHPEDLLRQHIRSRHGQAGKIRDPEGAKQRSLARWRGFWTR